jgi:hypothetical protein
MQDCDFMYCVTRRVRNTRLGQHCSNFNKENGFLNNRKTQSESLKLIKQRNTINCTVKVKSKEKEMF